MWKMKNLLLILSINLIFSSPLITFKEYKIPNLKMTKDEAKVKIFNNLREQAKKYIKKYPSGLSKLITNLASTTSIKLDQVPISSIDSLKQTHNLPNDIITKFKGIKYSKEISFELFTFKHIKSNTNIENIFGVVTRLDLDQIFFAYVRGNAKAKAITQFNTVRVKKCHKILFVKKCRHTNRKVKRGINANELEIIQSGLMAKFYETLNSVLDLDQQKMIDIFKKYSRKLIKPFPSNYKQLIVNPQTYLDFRTIYINLNGFEEQLKKIGFNDISINKIKSISNKKGSNVEIYQTIKDELLTQHFIVAVALNIENKIILSYAIGRGEVKLYYDYCYYAYHKKKRKGLRKKKILVEKNENCLDDDQCLSSCEEFKKMNPNPINPNGKDKEKHKKVIKESVIAELTQGINKILEEIQF